MYHLIIDTCIWIDLCKNFPDVLRKIWGLVENDKVRLILPSIVIDEWARHKPKIIEEKSQSLRGKFKNAKALSAHLTPEDATKFQDILVQFEEQPNKFESISAEETEIVETLFAFPTTVAVQITDEAKIQAADYALAKKAPFAEKNSMADALILFCAVNYVAAESITNCIFISSNFRDFSADTDKSEVHKDLKDVFEKHSIDYFINVGLAINHVETNLIDNESIHEIDDLLTLGDLQSAIQETTRFNLRLTDSVQMAGGLAAALGGLNNPLLNSALTDSVQKAGGLAAALGGLNNPLLNSALTDSVQNPEAISADHSNSEIESTNETVKGHLEELDDLHSL